MKKAEKIETLEVVSYEEKALAEYHITPEEVALKAKEYMALKVIPEDEASYKVARAALTTLVSLRTTGDKRRKAFGEDARNWVSAVNDAYKKLFSPLLPAEEHLQKELHIEDGRKAEIKAKKALEEKIRVDTIRASIDALKMAIVNTQGQTADEIHVKADAVLKMEVTREIFAEFFDEAITARLNAFQALCDAEQARRKWEKEEAQRKIEVERLAKQKAEQDAEAKRLADEKMKLEAEKKTEKERKDRGLFELAARQKAEVDARAKVEREEKERKAKEEAEAKAKAEREAQEAAEKARKEALRPDKEKILTFLGEIAAVQMPVVDGKADDLLQEIGKSIRLLLAKARNNVEDL